MFSKAFIPLLALAVSAVVASPPLAKRATCSGGQTTANEACCVWFDVLDDIQANLFDNGDCADEAHESLRLIFHDAIAFSPALTAQGQFGGGGADGSIMAHSDVELKYAANAGLDEIVEAQRPFALKHNVSFGDFIQFAGAVGAANCHGGPRIPFFAGRSNSSQAAPDGLVPLPTDSVDAILNRVEDAGFITIELVWMLISHTVASQHAIDTSIPGAPFDSTPKEFDPQFFVETLLNGTVTPGDGLHPGEVQSPLPGEFRLQSDFLISRDSRTSCEWQRLITNPASMVSLFESTIQKMSLLGFSQSSLTDCSDVIPVPTGTAANGFIPAGKSMSDIQPACAATPFPTLSVAPGEFDVAALG
ncbi:manganese-repressed peroxidase [Trametes cingulata]|nr:manganese-repressed peroxidase [Trametes cingulata]